MKLYSCATTPEHWVAEDSAGALMLFPAAARGWARRTLYRGHKRALVEVEARNAIGTGWPGVPVGRPPRAGEAATERVEIRLTKTELAELARNAKDVGLSVGALVRLRALGHAEPE